MLDRCRCCGVSLHGSDHCWKCGCEEYEERCDWPTGEPHVMYQLVEKLREMEHLITDWEVRDDDE